MAQMTFPTPTIKHCRGCGCQQWFYPEVCPIPRVVLCWKCRGQEFADFDEDEGDAAEDMPTAPPAALPVQMSLF